MKRRLLSGRAGWASRVRRGGTVVRSLLLLLLLLGAGTGPILAREAPPVAADRVLQASEAPAAQPRQASDAGSDPLPAPHLDRAYLHVFLAFGIAWALILGYVVALNRRVATAERDLRRLAEEGR